MGLEAESEASSCGQGEQLHLEIILLKVPMPLDANKAIGHTLQKHQPAHSDVVECPIFLGDLHSPVVGEKNPNVFGISVQH